MAETIAMIAQQYVAENASKYEGQAHPEAVRNLARDLREHLASEGWSAADYSIDLHALVDQQLKQYPHS